MRQETFTLSQKELQRVSVISACIKGDMACARAAGLLCLSVRQIKRLKKRMREDGEAALAHANRGRPSHRRLPDTLRRRIVHLARGIYAGFNDHHLCEKLVEREGFSLSRETLRRLLRNNGLGSPRKRRAPAHRQRRLRSACLGELVQLDGSPHDWLEGRGPLLTALAIFARTDTTYFCSRCGRVPAPKPKRLRFENRSLGEVTPGGDLRSHAVTRAVSSAQRGLTSVFGMGTGVTLVV